MHDIIQLQAYDAMDMDSVLNPEIMLITENTTHYIHCLI